MSTRLALLGSFALSLLLTGCPLTDHYTLQSDDLGGSGGAADSGGAGLGGASVVPGGSGGTSADAGAADAATGGDRGGGSAAGSSGNWGGSGAGGSGGDTGCVSGCSASQTCCASSCVNLTDDAQNCGACGTVCNVGRSCVASVCKSGWVNMSATAITPRSRAAIVAMGKSVFIWGGLDDDGNALADGAIYTPATDTWKTLPKGAGAPTARITPSAVWTGSVVIVFGGSDANVQNFNRDGGIYDPTANAWSVLPAPTTISRRNMPLAYWDGSRAVFWGGTGANATGVAGADRFDLSNWTNATNGGDPGALLYPAFGFDGSVLYLQGGILNGNRQDKVYSYTGSTNKWASLNKSLSARSSAFSAWDGSHFVVWGGRDDNGLRNDGKYLSGTTWTNVDTFGAPSARMIAIRRSGWSFQVSPGVVAVMGGQVSLAPSGKLTTNNGGVYNTETSAWATIPDWSSTDTHEYGMGAWTGEEFIVWGGRNDNGSTNTGQRWAP